MGGNELTGLRRLELVNSTATTAMTDTRLMALAGSLTVLASLAVLAVLGGVVAGRPVWC